METNTETNVAAAWAGATAVQFAALEARARLAPTANVSCTTRGGLYRIEVTTEYLQPSDAVDYLNALGTEG